MATMTTLTSAPPQPFRRDDNKILTWRVPYSVLILSAPAHVNRCYSTRSLNSGSSSRGLRPLIRPVSAVGSGLEASITDPKDNDIRVKNAEIVVESQNTDKMQVRVDVSGADTRIIFDKVLINLARTAPPVPGFRRQKGGKTSKVPKEFMLQILGEERVTNFVIKEIVSSVLADYTKKENLEVKENKISTLQTSEELRSLFVPGNEFGFNATLELVTSATETPM